MTEKRFIIAESKGTQWIEEMTLNAEPITNIAQAVKKLNDLSKENEQLKQKIISLEDARYSYKQDWKQASMDCDVYKNEINFLKDEKKGLIEENEQLRKDATTLIYANQDYRHENEQLKQKLKEHESTLKGQSNSIYQLKKKNELKESIDRIDSLIHTQEDYLAWSIIYETLTGGKPLGYRLKM